MGHGKTLRIWYNVLKLTNQAVSDQIHIFKIFLWFQTIQNCSFTINSTHTMVTGGMPKRPKRPKMLILSEINIFFQLTLMYHIYLLFVSFFVMYHILLTLIEFSR